MKTADGRDVYGISGGPMDQFREGWAILPVQASMQKPHYWRRIELTSRYVALCGIKGALATHEELAARGFVHMKTITPLEPGVFMAARCGTCQRMRQRQTRYFAPP